MLLQKPHNDRLDLQATAFQSAVQLLSTPTLALYRFFESKAHRLPWRWPTSHIQGP